MPYNLHFFSTFLTNMRWWQTSKFFLVCWWNKTQ